MIHGIFKNFRKYEYLILTLLLCASYFLIVLSFDYLQGLDDTMFLWPDSKSYRAVGDWLFGIENTHATNIRPFFYPLMLNLSRSFAGIYGIWCYHFVLWILSGVLLYRCIRKATNSIVLSVAGIFIFASNLTLLLLTLHALTEVTVTFLLTTFIILVITKRQYNDMYYWLLMLFIASLLTVTKPLYIYLVFIILLYRIPVFIRNIMKGQRKLKLIGYIALAVCPLLIQLSIMKTKHNEFSISQVDRFTAKYYYLARVYAEVNDISLYQAEEHIRSFDRNELFEYVLTHPREGLHTFFKSVMENIMAKSIFINFPNAHPHLYSYMKAINLFYFRLQLFMLGPSLIVLIVLFKKRKWADLETILSLMLPMYLILLTSGITFGQGDRIVLPSLPLWIVLYSLITSQFWLLIRENRPTRWHFTAIPH